MSQKQADPESAEAYRDRARQLLLSAHSRGQSDGEADAALARLLRERESAAALRLARESLRDQSLSPKSRVNSLFLIAEVEVRENRYSSARQVLEELTAVRRLSEDWRLLALCHQSSGDVPGALHSLEKAIEIAPFRPELHAALAGLLQHAGRADAARRESATAERLAALGNRRH
jgi:tetratricopeptide (TPR) repeat protein